MASSAEAQGSLLRAAGVEDEEESTAPSSAVRVSLPSREGGSPAVESAGTLPHGYQKNYHMATWPSLPTSGLPMQKIGTSRLPED